MSLPHTLPAPSRLRARPPRLRERVSTMRALSALESLARGAEPPATDPPSPTTAPFPSSHRNRGDVSSDATPSPAPPLRVISWDQDTTSVFVRVAIPRGTPARAVRVDVRPRKLSISVDAARVEDIPGQELCGTLRHPCVAAETIWTLERHTRTPCNRDEDPHDLLHVLLVKRHGRITDPAWRGLLEGDREKTHAETLRELVDCDEPSCPHDQLPDDAREAVEELRERRLAMGRGEWRPDDGEFDDFRIVLVD